MKSWGNKMIEYLLIIMLIYMSGNILFIAYNYDVSVKYVFLITLTIFLIKIKVANKNRLIEVIMVFIVLCSSMIFTILLNEQQDINSYIAIAMQIWLAVMICMLIGFESFKAKYVIIMVGFSLISLVFYSVQFVVPTIVYYFPQIKGYGALDYYNAYIHMYSSSIGYAEGTLVLFKRNSSIFWEPGCFQAFINVALFFLLEDIQSGKVKEKYQFKLLILVIALITTYSTTGYLILFILIIKFKGVFFASTKRKILSSAVFMGTIIFILYVIQEKGLSFDFLINKIINEFSSMEYVKKRVSFENIFYDGKFHFFGISFEKYYEISEVGSSNSIIHTLYTLGVVFTGILLLMYYKFSCLFSKNKVIMMILLAVVFSTESLFWRPFFLYLAFVHFYYGKNSQVKIRGDHEGIMAK